MAGRTNKESASQPESAPLSVIGRTEFSIRAGRVQGDFLNSGADVLVIPADTGFVMRGGVANKVKAAGGKGIADELRAHKPLSPGDVVITSAGKLKAKNLYHAVISSWSLRQKGQREELKVLQATLWRAVSRCLSLVQLTGMSSIAFPSMGTGSGKADRFESHSTMAAACLDALQPDSSLQRILFCFDNPDTAEIFRTAFLQQRLIRKMRGLTVRTQAEREELSANMGKVWRVMMKMDANVETLAALVRALEQKPSAAVINYNIGNIINSNAVAIGQGSQAVVRKND